jgi:hypothetical protein
MLKPMDPLGRATNLGEQGEPSERILAGAFLSFARAMNQAATSRVIVA